MTNSKLDRVMQFYRVDGSSRAPVCFLTIEDGGELKQEEFDQYISGKPEWIPQDHERPLCYESVGLPGEFISKIMVYAFADVLGIDDWMEYRAKHLYDKNECNLKFYPVGRQNTNTWQPWLESKLGVSAGEYRIQCISERPAFFDSQCKEYLGADKLFVILGARDEWSYVLRRYVFNSCYRTLQAEGDAGCVVTEKFEESTDKLLYACYSMFTWGNRSDDKLQKFARHLRKYTPKETLTALTATES